MKVVKYFVAMLKCFWPFNSLFQSSEHLAKSRNISLICVCIFSTNHIFKFGAKYASIFGAKFKLTISNTFPLKIIYKCNQNTIVNAFNSLLQIFSSSNLPLPLEDGDLPSQRDKTRHHRARGRASAVGGDCSDIHLQKRK